MKRKFSLNILIIIIIILLIICCTGATILWLSQHSSSEINEAEVSENESPSEGIFPSDGGIDNNVGTSSDGNITITNPNDVVINNPEPIEEDVFADVDLKNLEGMHEPISKLTASDKHEYLECLSESAEKVATEYGVSCNVMLCIALHNSNWGENDYAAYNNPVGFIAGEEDDYIVFTVYEGDENNQTVAKDIKIKTYESVEECFRDLAILMKEKKADKQFDDMEDLMVLSETDYVQKELESVYRQLLYELSSRVKGKIDLDNVKDYELKD